MWGTKLDSPGSASSGGMPIAPHCTQPYPPVITCGNASATSPSSRPPTAGLSCLGIGIGLKSLSRSP